MALFLFSSCLQKATERDRHQSKFASESYPQENDHGWSETLQPIFEEIKSLSETYIVREDGFWAFGKCFTFHTMKWNKQSVSHVEVSIAKESWGLVRFADADRPVSERFGKKIAVSKDSQDELKYLSEVCNKYLAWLHPIVEMEEVHYTRFASLEKGERLNSDEKSFGWGSHLANEVVSYLEQQMQHATVRHQSLLVTTRCYSYSFSRTWQEQRGYRLNNNIEVSVNSGLAQYWELENKAFGSEVFTEDSRYLNSDPSNWGYILEKTQTLEKFCEDHLKM